MPLVTQNSRRYCRWPYLLDVRWRLLRCSVGDAAVLITTRLLPGGQQGFCL